MKSFRIDIQKEVKQSDFGKLVSNLLDADVIEVNEKSCYGIQNRYLLSIAFELRRERLKFV